MNQLISEVKKATEDIKRLKGRVDSIFGNVSFVSNGAVSGVLLSDADPQPVSPTTPDPGISPLASRDDHVHVGASGKYRQFTYTGDVPFEFIVDGEGQPVFDLKSLE